MAEPQDSASLVSHFLQSKKALAQGQVLCSHASELNSGTVSIVVEALAFEAKSKFLSQGVVDQLNLAGSIAKSLTQQRAKLLEEARGWDSLRSERIQSLDAILENLGLQHVPPELHVIASGSSLFGSQASLQQPVEVEETEQPAAHAGNSSVDLKSKWKTLRDFVDERAIEEALEHMEEDRTALDDILASTSTHATILTKHIADIRASFSDLLSPPRPMEAILNEQDVAAIEMANRLESLTVHYDQMTRALEDEEAGHILSDQDMLIFVRDTNELPHILSELESSVHTIESAQDEASAYREDTRRAVETFNQVIIQLENLESVMDDMLNDYADMQNEAAGTQQALETHHVALRELEGTYHSYQLAYDRLIIEMDRRAKYRREVEKMVSEVQAHLNVLWQDEFYVRQSFEDQHKDFLPKDLCPSISDAPDRYTIEIDKCDGAVSLSDSVVLEAKRNLDLPVAEGEFSL